MRADDPDFDSRMGERKALQEQLTGLNERLITAYQAEDQDAQLAMARHVDTDGWSAELREFRDLAQKTSIVNYMAATVQEKRVGGAEAEYNDHVFGGSWQQGEYPLEMLLPRSEVIGLSAHAIADMRGGEQRTEITGVVAGSEGESYVARLLDASDGAYLRRILPRRWTWQAQLPDCVWGRRWLPGDCADHR